MYIFFNSKYRPEVVRPKRSVKFIYICMHNLATINYVHSDSQLCAPRLAILRTATTFRCNPVYIYTYIIFLPKCKLISALVYVYMTSALRCIYPPFIKIYTGMYVLYTILPHTKNDAQIQMPKYKHLFMLSVLKIMHNKYDKSVICYMYICIIKFTHPEIKICKPFCSAFLFLCAPWGTRAL